MGFKQVEEQRPQAMAPFGFSRVMSAAWDLGEKSRETSGLAVINAVNNLNKEGSQVDPVELNKEFPGLEADKPMTKQAAQFIYDEKQEEMKLRQIVANGSDNFLTGTVAPFAAEMTSSLMDPVGVAVGMMTGQVIGSAQKAAKAGKWAKAAGTFIDNAIGATISETIIMEKDNQLFKEYTAGQMLTNVVGGSMMMTGIMHGASSAWSKLKKMGGKSIHATQGWMSNAIEAGKNPSEALDMVLKQVDDDLTIKGDMEAIFARNFEDKISLEPKSDLKDMFKAVEDAYVEGKINASDVTSFKNELLDNGFDERLLKYSQEDGGLNMPQAVIENVKTKLDDKTSDFGYSEEAESIRIAKEEYNAEAPIQENIQNLEQKMQAIEGLENKTDFEVKQLEDIKNFKAIEEERMNIFSEVATCYGI